MSPVEFSRSLELPAGFRCMDARISEVRASYLLYVFLVVLKAKRDITIRNARRQDAQAIADIYNHYVKTSIMTFEEEPLTSQDMGPRIEAVQCASLPWFIAEAGQHILGYAYATPWKARSAYRFSVETSVYMDFAHTGRGTGSLLYGRLLAALQNGRTHVAIAGISLPNEASIALHVKFGVRKVAHFPEVGFKFDRWIDVGYWQRVL